MPGRFLTFPSLSRNVGGETTGIRNPTNGPGFEVTTRFELLAMAAGNLRMDEDIPIQKR
jgi:hypothetical protein